MEVVMRHRDSNCRKAFFSLLWSFVFALLLGGWFASAVQGMEIVGSLSLPNRMGIVVRDTVVYTVGGTNFTTVSIAHPASPYVLDQLELSMTLQSVDVAGDYAYCVGGSGALAVVDISDPRALRLAHTVALTGSCLDVAVEDTIIAIAANTMVAILGIRNPALPRFLSSYAQAASSVALHWPTRRIYAGGTNGVVELDITDPIHPARHSQYGAGQSLTPLEYSEPYVDVASGATLFTLNANPLSQAGTYAASAAVRAICEAGGYQTLIGLANGTVIHLSEIAMPPEQVASVNVGSEVRRMDVGEVSGDSVAVVATAGGITIVRFEPVSVAEPYHPQLNPDMFRMSAYPNPFNSSVRLQLTGGKSGWHIFELFDLTGRKVVSERIFLAGEREFVFEPAALGTGVYFARISGVSGSALTRLVYLK
jgi:hypothetical protein